MWGAVAFLAGVVAALGIYWDAAGPLGRWLGTGAGWVVGLGRFALPVALIVSGALLTAAGVQSSRDSREVDEGGGEPGGDAGDGELEPTRGKGARRQVPAPARVIAGVAVFLASLCGFIELASGSPGLRASRHVLVGAGGYAGVVAGGSLRDVAGTAGAVVILAALAVSGTMLSTGVSLAELARGISALSRWAARAAAKPRWKDSIAPGAVEAESAATPLVRTSEGEVFEPVTREGPDGPSVPESEDHSAHLLGGGEAGEGQGAADISAISGEQALLAPSGGRAPSTARSRGAAGERSRGEGDWDGVPVQLDMGFASEARRWKLPPLSLLERTGNQRADQSQAATGARVLKEALASHGVEADVTGYSVGPTVTRYEVEIAAGVKVSQVTNLSRDIAYAMASPDVRILAPIPGRSAIGVEVPNHYRQLVCLGDILASKEAREATHPLEVALGRDISGKPVMANLAEMPHVLIAGATGAGKSSCINSLVTSLLMRTTPEQVRLILVDPKRVELGQYNGLPHLLTQVVVDPRRAANALSWAVKEMERRYDLLASVGVRDITGYNQLVASGMLDDEDLSGEDVGLVEDEAGDAAGAGGDVQDATDVEEENTSRDRRAENAASHELLPFIVVVVDELNDLMMVAARDVEESVCRIAQMARAVGIHLVIATQRPSVDVITGVIKANIPSRLAFSVSSLADSRVILDQPGAERLVGKGDLLMLTASSSVPVRIQGPWVSEQEIRKVVAHWRRQGGARYVEGVEGEVAGPGSGAADEDDDDLLGAAMELVVRSQLGSTSMLQRKLRVGFARAGRLMDLLERRGVVGPSEGSKARAVLMTPEELDEMLQRSAR